MGKFRVFNFVVYYDYMENVCIIGPYNSLGRCDECSVARAIVNVLNKGKGIKRITLAGPVDFLDSEFIASTTGENELSYHAGTFSVPVCRVCQGMAPKKDIGRVIQLSRLGSPYKRYEVLT